MISVKKQNDVRLLSFVDDVEQIIRETDHSRDPGVTRTPGCSP